MSRRAEALNALANRLAWEAPEPSAARLDALAAEANRDLAAAGLAPGEPAELRRALAEADAWVRSEITRQAAKLAGLKGRLETLARARSHWAIEAGAGSVVAVKILRDEPAPPARVAVIVLEEAVAPRGETRTVGVTFQPAPDAG